MPTRLYLDTARLGLMSRSAQQVHIDFIRFAGEEGGSLYLDRFLRTGTRSWPQSLQRRYPALRAWNGISHLKEGLKALAEAPADWEVLLANRSAHLMRTAAGLLFRLCRNVLVTDLTWPSYRLILQRVRRRSGNRLTEISLRGRILRHAVGEDEVVDEIVRYYLKNECDGLFLPAVDNLGVRLPVERIVRRIEAWAEPRFVVIDGAQAFGHVPLRLVNRYCDFCIAGCHKWLGAYHPMGLALYGHGRSAGYVRQTIHRLRQRGSLADPLLRFVGELEGNTPTRYGETVNIAPLFSCQGAVGDSSAHTLASDLRQRIANADTLVSLLAASGWRPLLPSEGLRSGIVLLQASGGPPRTTGSRALRHRLHKAGLALTTYSRGIVRVSLPPEPWRPADLELATRAFGRVAQTAAKAPAALAS